MLKIGLNRDPQGNENYVPSAKSLIMTLKCKGLLDCVTCAADSGFTS